MHILKESVSSTAWCITRDGKAIPVRVHPFGALDDDSTEDASWLYLMDSTYDKDLLVQYIANQLCYDYNLDSLWNDVEIRELVNECLFDIECLKGVTGVSSLVETVSDYIINVKANTEDEGGELLTLTPGALSLSGKHIKKHLNENYLRARLGSEYQNYTERRGAIYFRTSSTDGFNWYPVIFDFLSKISEGTRIKEVTVERDVSATGDRLVYIDHISFEDFLMKKPFVIESVQRCGTIKEDTSNEK